MVLKNAVFYQKLKILCSFTSLWYKHFSRNVWRDFRLSMSALATVAGKVLTANLLQKLIFRSGIYVTISDADIESLKSLHTLFDKYLDHMLVKFEQNHMVRTIQNLDLFDKKKNGYPFLTKC